MSWCRGGVGVVVALVSRVVSCSARRVMVVVGEVGVVADGAGEGAVGLGVRLRWRSNWVVLVVMGRGVSWMGGV